MYSYGSTPACRIASTLARRVYRSSFSDISSGFLVAAMTKGLVVVVVVVFFFCLEPLLDVVVGGGGGSDCVVVPTDAGNCALSDKSSCTCGAKVCLSTPSALS